MQRRHAHLAAAVVAGLLLATCATEEPPWAAEAETWIDTWFAARHEGIRNELVFYDPNVVWEDRTGGHVFTNRDDFVTWAGYVLGEVDPSELVHTFVSADEAMVQFRWPNWDPPVDMLSRVHITPNGIEHLVNTGSTTAGRVYGPDMADFDAIDALARRWLDVWNGDGSAVDDLYVPGARIEDSLLGRAVTGSDAIAAAVAHETWPDLPTVTLEPLPSGMGSAVMVGPGVRESDLDEVALVVRVGSPACPQLMAVFLGWDGRRVLWERRGHELLGARACEPTETFRAGWWVGLVPPEPIARVFSGVVREPTTGWEVSVYNASDELQGVIARMLGRFIDAGIGVPEVHELAFLDYKTVCTGWAGFTTDGPEGSVVNICLDQDRICTDGTCDQIDPHAELLILHELAHVWLFDHTDEELRREFTAFVGLDAWNDLEVDWSDRAMERAASAIAVGVAQLGDAPCDDGRYCDVAPGSFELLTGTTAPDR